MINRAVARLPLFEKAGDYEAFERVLALAQGRAPLPIFSDILMPNHWHFVVRPETDTQVTVASRLSRLGKTNTCWLCCGMLNEMRYEPICVSVLKTGRMAVFGGRFMAMNNWPVTASIQVAV